MSLCDEEEKQYQDFNTNTFVVEDISSTSWFFDVLHSVTPLSSFWHSSILIPLAIDDVMHFEVTICPDEGYYLHGAFVFSFQASPLYPHEPPKVKCKTKVYHPNIDLEGNVCLNILREDWKPVLNVNTIIYGLYHLFTEPNHEDPLNYEAAAVLRENPKLFESNVRRAVSGDLVDGTWYPSAYCPYTDEE
ncbi:UNVERIFIED_CONTAM: NEDD8-conjugating enzyme Ubc12 [Sesamum latifolium]|uniref:NEDD8-conjugating enzyme Ubc12 n=1 Tax=Sesamum latifolium TaxID=2727402 RepID=A0AAW2VT89_9LAMI